jgi:hypothetical protein
VGTLIGEIRRGRVTMIGSVKESGERGGKNRPSGGRKVPGIRRKGSAITLSIRVHVPVTHKEVISGKFKKGRIDKFPKESPTTRMLGREVEIGNFKKPPSE